MDQLTMEGLVETITQASSKVQDYLRSADQPMPSFHPNGPKTFPPAAPPDVARARADLIVAARQLYFLSLWPTESVNWHTVIPSTDMACLNWLMHFKVFFALPLDGTISLSDLAQKCNVDEGELTRVLRLAMVNFWFREPEPGQIAHSAASSLVVTSEATSSQLTYQLMVNYRSAPKLAEASERSRAGEHKTAFNLAFGTEMGSAQWAGQSETNAPLYAGMMKTFQTNSSFSVRHIVEGYDWKALDDKAHVVDVGGNCGDTAIAIARANPMLTFTVQDQPATIAIGQAQLPSDLSSRIRLQAHDFLTPEPVKAASIYLLRFILHDWPDSKAILILQNVISAMGPRSRIVIADSIVASDRKGISQLQDKYSRNMHIMMMTTHGAKERSEDEWRDLIARADANVEISRIIKPEAAQLALLEVVRNA